MGVDAPSGWAETDAALVRAIAEVAEAQGRPVLIALAGSQGSGKSTLAARLVGLLEAAGLRTAVLALDDFYLSRAARLRLAGEIHPLLATRGVPGTHDLARLHAALDALLAGASWAVPRFDKTTDDLGPQAEWREIPGPVDVVLLEGWCLGARSQDAAALALPVNALEASEDADRRWRDWVNRQLAGPYAALFARFDLSILLKAPDFAVVADWRAEQERGLVRSPGGLPRMTGPDIARFIAHYERITRAMLEDEPTDIVVELDFARVPRAIRCT